MTASKQPHWPLRPSLIAHALDGMARALDNIASEYSDDRHDELVGLMVAIRVFSAEISAFFAEQKLEDERVLDALEELWLKRSQL